MQRLICLMMCVTLAQPAWSQNVLQYLTPSPLTILLTIGQWMKKDRIEVFYVQVQAHGRDETDAREQAFRLAVNQAVGSLLLSHREVRDDAVKRNEIINYSSGYVHDFKILERQSAASGTTIKIDVWVRRSGIADRLLNESRDAGRVEGGRISEQIASIQRERQTSDRVVSAVAQDFPQRAFDISLSATRVTMDDRRQARLHVPFSVAWNSVYVRSMAEAVTAINQRPDCLRWLANCYTTGMVHVGRQASAYFDDRVVFDMLHQELVISRPMVRMTVQDSVGSTLLTRCFSVAELDHSSYAPWYFVDVGPGYVTLNTHSSRRYEITLDLGGLPVKNMDRVDVRIVRGSQCLS